MTLKFNIAIIEDNTPRANDLKKRIEKLGYKVTSISATTSDAIKSTDEDTIDIVLLATTLKSGIDDIIHCATNFQKNGLSVIYLFDDPKLIDDPKIPDSCGSIIAPVQDNELRIALEFASYKKSAQEKINEIQNQLARNDHELESFVHMASHDLRSPLQSIATYTGILQDYVEAHEPDEEIIQFMERIFSNVRTMANLIADFVHISRLSRRKNSFEQVEPQKLIKSALERLEQDIKSSKAKVTVQKTLPKIICDRVKFSELFYNIISNAIKFSSKRDSGHPEINISYTRDDNTHTFCISDNGIGLDLRYHEKIFKPFIKLHSKDEYPGSGLGLYLVKNIIDGHNGTVWFESEKYNGSSCYVTLPVMEDTATSNN